MAPSAAPAINTPWYPAVIARLDRPRRRDGLRHINDVVDRGTGWNRVDDLRHHDGGRPWTARRGRIEPHAVRAHVVALVHLDHFRGRVGRVGHRGAGDWREGRLAAIRNLDFSGGGSRVDLDRSGNLSQQHRIFRFRGSRDRAQHFSGRTAGWNPGEILAKSSGS